MRVADTVMLTLAAHAIRQWALDIYFDLRIDHSSFNCLIQIHFDNHHQNRFHRSVSHILANKLVVS